MVSKKDRQIIFNKFGGRCAYCGCELDNKFHVDELEPCVRLYKQVREDGVWKRKFIGYANPEKLSLENQMPACPSCNINKHSMSLEDFRKLIAGFLKSLNERFVQYKVAKRYGLIQEIDKPIVFYFELFNKKPTTESSGLHPTLVCDAGA